MSKATSLGRVAAVGILATLLSTGVLHAADPESSSTPMSSASPPASPTTGPLLEWEQTITSQEPRGWLSEVVVWSGGFATLGRDETGNNTVWTSRDGRSWTADHLPLPKRIEPHLGSVGRRLVVVAAVPQGDIEHLASWSSLDGRRWRRAPDRPSMALPTQSQPRCFRIRQPVAVGGSLVVHGECDVGSRGSIGSTIAGTDGSTSVLLAAETRQNGIYSWRTTDGRRWTRRPITRTLDDLDCVEEDGDGLIGLDYGTPLVRSEDGFEWSFVGDVPIGSSPPDSACVWPTTSGYLQVGGVETLRGYDGATGTSVSVDGTDWSSTQTLLGFELELDGVAVLGDTVILDGFQSGPDLPEPAVAAQLLSIDGGATWAPTSGWPSTTVVTDGQVIVAVGDGAWVATLPEALQAS